MGYEFLAESCKQPFPECYRDQFPVTEKLIYLHHAGVAPLCRAAADAMKGLAEDAWRFGSFHYEEWLATYDALRAARGFWPSASFST